ncbi:MAG: preprotein translocase subunit SecG [Candidatus Paceibacteria bacterium]
MERYLALAQILTALVLIGLILLQQRGAGLSGAFGGQGEFYGTRRGLEKSIFRLTIIFAGLFILIALLSLIF